MMMVEVHPTKNSPVGRNHAEAWLSGIEFS